MHYARDASGTSTLSLVILHVRVTQNVHNIYWIEAPDLRCRYHEHQRSGYLEQLQIIKVQVYPNNFVINLQVTLDIPQIFFLIFENEWKFREMFPVPMWYYLNEYLVTLSNRSSKCQCLLLV